MTCVDSVYTAGVAITLNDLAQRTGVSPRTIRYYIQQGLMPSPGGMGPRAAYEEESLLNLRLIRHWQDHFLPLAEIRARLEALSIVEKERVLAGVGDSEAPSPKMAEVTSAAEVGESAGDYAAQALAAATPRERPRTSTTVGPAPGRSIYERLVLSPDVELHIRRPLTRTANRQVDALVAEARRLFTTT